MANSAQRAVSDRKQVRPAARGSAQPILKFKVELEGHEGSGIVSFFRVPAKVMATFAPRRRVPVVVTVNGYTWRSTISPYGTEFFVPVRAEIRLATDAALGERVDVALQHDTAERRVDVPKDLALALDGAGVRAGFDALSFTCQKEYVQAIESAKRPETRQRRVDQAVAKAKEKQARKKA
jgi:hypothetical protein